MTSSGTTITNNQQLKLQLIILHCITSAIDNLSAKVTARVMGQEVNYIQWEDASETQNVLRQRTEDTIRLKASLVCVVQRFEWSRI